MPYLGKIIREIGADSLCRRIRMLEFRMLCLQRYKTVCQPIVFTVGNKGYSFLVVLVLIYLQVLGKLIYLFFDAHAEDDTT